MPHLELQQSCRCSAAWFAGARRAVVHGWGSRRGQEPASAQPAGRQLRAPLRQKKDKCRCVFSRLL